MAYRVLIVEDEERIREGLRELIVQLVGGFVIAGEAANGKEGLALARVERPDLIMTDIRMPVMSGIDMISQLRQQQMDVSVIILSGYDDFEYAQQALRHRVDDYLLKPISRVELAQALQKFKEARELQRHHQAKAGAGAEEADKSRNDRLIIRQVKEIVGHQLDRSLTLQEVAEQVFLNPQYLSFLFKNETGQNFSDFVTEERVKKAKQLLKSTNLKVREIAVLCGYTHEKYFMSVFKQNTGLTPSAYRDA